MSKKVVKIEFEWDKPRDLELKMSRIYKLLISGKEMYENATEYRDHYLTFVQFYKAYRDYEERKENGNFVHIVQSKIK
jgi:hypothetical protein